MERGFYVGSFERNIDDRHRLQLPAEFEIVKGEIVYIERKEQELLCYDSTRFAEMAKEFQSSIEFGKYTRVRVESHHRIVLNGNYSLPRKVLVEGRGDHFSVCGAHSIVGRILGFMSRKTG